MAAVRPQSCDANEGRQAMASARIDPIPAAQPEPARAGPTAGTPAVPGAVNAAGRHARLGGGSRARRLVRPAAAPAAAHRAVGRADPVRSRDKPGLRRYADRHRAVRRARRPVRHRRTCLPGRPAAAAAPRPCPAPRPAVARAFAWLAVLSAPWARSWAWPGCSPSPPTTTALPTRPSTHSWPPMACGSPRRPSRWPAGGPTSPELPSASN